MRQSAGDFHTPIPVLIHIVLEPNGNETIRHCERAGVTIAHGSPLAFTNGEYVTRFRKSGKRDTSRGIENSSTCGATVKYFARFHVATVVPLRDIQADTVAFPYCTRRHYIDLFLLNREPDVNMEQAADTRALCDSWCLTPCAIFARTPERCTRYGH